MSINKKALRSTTPFSLAMGAEIARLRREKALSGKELGDLVGLSQQQISRYENGVCEMTTVMLCGLLYCLEVSLEAYFDSVAKHLEKNNHNFYTKYAFVLEQSRTASNEYHSIRFGLDIHH